MSQAAKPPSLAVGDAQAGPCVLAPSDGAFWPPDSFVLMAIGLLRRADTFLFGLRFPAFCVLVLALAILQNGLWVVPTINGLRHYSSDMTRQLTPNDGSGDYLYSSSLGFFLAYLTGSWDSIASFALLHFVFLTVGTIWLLWLARHKLGEQRARLLVLAFVTLPISNVLFTWLGMSDVYVFVFSTAVVLSDSAINTLVLAVLLGLAHFEQGMVIAGGLALVWLCEAMESAPARKRLLLRAAALLGGVAGSHMLLNRYFAACGFHLTVNRLALTRRISLVHFLTSDLHHFGTLIFSLYGCFWLVVLAAVHSTWHTGGRLVFGIVGANLVFLFFALFTLDETRVFTLLGWPFFVLVLKSGPALFARLHPYVVVAFLLGLVLPKLIVWDGAIHSSALYDALLLVGRTATGHGYQNSDWLMYPFRR